MFRAPAAAALMPPFSLMADDIPVKLGLLARHLGVSERTAQRYRVEGAPRAVMLATFWETRWGRSTADCEAHNFGMVHRAHAQSLEREKAVLLLQIAEMERLFTSGQGVAPNSPFFLPGQTHRQI